MYKKEKVLYVFGTRPESIKLAPIIRKLPGVVINTGQHVDILDLLDIKVDYNLNCMDKYNTLTEKLGYALLEISDKAPESVEMVIVQGDTMSALAGAFFAYFNRKKLVHIEAGLRTYDQNEPYPEEAIRYTIDHISDVLFAPTDFDAADLYDEGIDDDKIFTVGNTIVDSIYYIMDKYSIDISTEPYVVITIHRRENDTKDRVESIFKGIRSIAAQHPDLNFIYPVHPSYQYAHKKLSDVQNITLLPPMPYKGFITLLSGCKYVISDSGGIQEECAVLHKPVVILRERTERFSVINEGIGILAGTSYDDIVESCDFVFKNYKKMCSGNNPFGDGTTSDKIVEVVKGLV